MTVFREEVIGDARLILGDAREVLPTLGKVDMIFTDPPYGHNNNNGDLIHRWEAALGQLPSDDNSSLARPIANDGAEETAALIEWFFSQLPALLWPGSCCCCCCGGGGPDPQFARWSLEMDRHIDFKQMVVWDKGPMGMGWHYRRSYETVLVGQRPGAACRWFDTTDAVENIIRPGAHGVRKIIPSAADHPTPKPPQLAQHFIRLHTTDGQTVLDPFMGGGSTAIAAVEEGRKFLGVEIEPRWFELAVDRLKTHQKSPSLFRALREPAIQLDILDGAP